MCSHCAASSLDFPPRWNVDPRTGIEAPLIFGKELNYREPALVGDIKYLWEPNRHMELVTLAQAWHLTHEERYLRRLPDVARFLDQSVSLSTGRELVCQSRACNPTGELVVRVVSARG